MLLESDFNEDHKRMYEIMSDMSESRWHAGWVIGNEKTIWEMDMSDWPEELIHLHFKLGGWIIWAGEDYHHTDYDGPAFVSTEVWEKLQHVWVGGNTNDS